MKKTIAFALTLVLMFALFAPSAFAADKKFIMGIDPEYPPFSYLDDNGEFVTPLTYSEADDALYWDGALYAVRDNTFVRDN